MVRMQQGNSIAGRLAQRWLCAAVALASCGSGGCAHRQACCDRNCASSAAGDRLERFEEPLAETQRGSIAADVAAVTDYRELTPGKLTALPADSTHYHALDAEECRRRAVENAALANLLTSEAHSVADGRCAATHGADLRRELLELRATDERNRAAGTALEAFYHLAEAEAGSDSIRRGIAQVDQARDDVAQLRGNGLPIDVDASALDRQRIVWLQKREEVERSLGELNAQLSHLIGVEAETSTPIWPVADWHIAPRDVHVDDAIAQGLTTRADLALLRRLDESLDVDSLPAARGALMQVDPMLGQSGVPARLMARAFGSQGDACELVHRRQQIRMLLSDRERSVTDEIRQAAATLESRYREIALAKENVASWTQRVDALRRRRGAGKVSPFDISAAEAELLRAESALTAKVVAWQIAEVQLRQAQGLLAP
jgi:hypothetical protein